MPALARGLAIPVPVPEAVAIDKTLEELALLREGGGGGAGPFLADMEVTVLLLDRPIAPLPLPPTPPAIPTPPLEGEPNMPMPGL